MTTVVASRPTNPTQPNPTHATHHPRYAAGFRTKHQKQDVICKMARLYYDRNNKASTEGLHVQLYLEKLQAEDPIVCQVGGGGRGGRGGSAHTPIKVPGLPRLHPTHP